MRKFFAFTLAEVLITLGIIGVVAALTMPVLVQKHRNSVIETSLQKFYSVMNQAVERSEIDNGAREYWFQDFGGADIDDDGNPVAGTSDAQKWFNQYLAPYLQITKQELDSSGRLIVYFSDGSAVKNRFTDSSREWIFYPKNPQKCMDIGDKGVGTCSFVFIYYPAKAPTGNGNEGPAWSYHLNKGFEPYKYGWDGNFSSLYNRCISNSTSIVNRVFCTAIIQYNGWKIPDNYPLRIGY